MLFTTLTKSMGKSGKIINIGTKFSLVKCYYSCVNIVRTLSILRTGGDFSGDSELKNPCANARPTGLIPALGRFHLPQGN